MNYPLISEYVQSIRFSEENFDKLSNLCPVLDEDGNPVMFSGNFAIVFKMQDKQTGKLHAVKCFLREQEGREESYKLIASELEYVSSTFLTPIQYLEKEIFVDTTQGEDTEFPVLLMDWVEGLTLDKYIRNNIHDPYKLALITYQFCRMGSWLLSQEFAHGDLKPDNIIVREDGQLVLVDYDGMFVPAMRGQKARELGSVDYRHPLRREDVFNGNIDDFSIASIALSLKVISLKPELFDEFGEGDRLLLCAKDYIDLKHSLALNSIQKMIDDTELLQLLGLFYLAYSKNELSKVSYHLLKLKKPEYLSVIATDDNIQDAFIDEYGVRYSKDGLRLLKAPKELKEYVIREGTKVICVGAFWHCENLSNIKFPNTIQYIGYCAFGYCMCLSSIKLPESVFSIGAMAFSNCYIIKEINIPRLVRSIYYNPFGFTQIDKVYCNSEYFIIENNVLYDSDKRRLISSFNRENNFCVPSTVQEISEAAFAGCEKMESICIPNGILKIKDYVFLSCGSLTKIEIHGVIEFLGKEVFPKCYIYNGLVRSDELEVIYIPQGTINKFVELLTISNNCDFIKKLKEME